MKAKILSLFMTWLIAGSAFAGNLSNADALFEQRGEGIAQTRSARAAYIATLQDLDHENMKYAVSQICRLTLYDRMLFPVDRNNSRSLSYWNLALSEVLAAIERIAPNRVGQNVEYYFWRATMLAIKTETLSTLSTRSVGKEMLTLIDKGLTIINSV